MEHKSFLMVRPLSAREEPHYSGLVRDAHHVVVGEQGLLVVYGRWRCAAFLAALSQEMNLAQGVAVEPIVKWDEPQSPQPAAGGNLQEDVTGKTVDELAGDISLVTLTPSANATTRSPFYDTILHAMRVARLRSSHAMLMVGDGRVFVPYADSNAPYGYDVEGEIPASGRVIVGPRGTLHLPEPQPSQLLNALLHVPLQQASYQAPPTMLSVLTDRRLASFVINYIQRHGLAYALRFITWQGSEHVLCDVVVADEVRPISHFVIDFLDRLPRTTLLVDAVEEATLETEPSRRILVAWGHHTPLFLPHVEEILPPESLLLFPEATKTGVLLHPRSSRYTMAEVTDVTVPSPAVSTLSPASTAMSADEDKLSFSIDIDLQHETNIPHPVHGLLLDEKSLQRLRRMVAVLPESFFAQTQIAMGDGVAILVPHSIKQTMSGVPLGLPLVRTVVPELLIPHGMRLTPTLAPDILVSALKLKPNMLTILTPTHRYDVAFDALHPVKQLLRAPDVSHTIAITNVPEEEEPPSYPIADPSSPPPQENLKQPHQGWQSNQGEQAHQEGQSALPPGGVAGIMHVLGHGRQKNTLANNETFEKELRQRAKQLEKQGEYEIAAAFYSYLKDDKQAALCYRRVLDQEG